MVIAKLIFPFISGFQRQNLFAQVRIPKVISRQLKEGRFVVPCLRN